jgi:zinc transport system substrate-binding protein
MVGPGQSPATYEPTPAQMTLFRETRLYFSIGVPFEKVWLARIAEANPKMEIIDTGGQVTMRSQEGREEHDPHIWTSPLLADHIARTMKDAFISIDPDNQVQYEQNYSLLAADMRKLDMDIRLKLAPLERRSFLVYHPAWGYFADTYGLEQVAIEEHGSEPGAKHLVEVIENARREGMRVVFVQEQFSRRNAVAVAAEAGLKVVAIDPLSADYIDNLRLVAGLFAEALR